ncbi:MAG: sulfur oxidation c-type cytochrome SoxA [Burkholderiales bacterium]
MKKMLLAILSASLLFGAISANATPEQDRKQILEYFKHKFPNVKFDDYVHGALVFSPDALDQYREIMQFPPFESVIEKGKKMWETPFKNGKTYASCFPDGAKNIAGRYPYFDEKLGKVVTFEMAINACRKANGENELSYADMGTMGVLTSYARTLSDGMLMDIKVEGPRAEAAYERGKRHFYQRRGQLNFSCASCHVHQAGNIIRTEYLSPLLGQATHWPVFRGGENLFTLQKRYTGCNKLVRAVPFPFGSEEYNDLEYFHSYMSNGLPMHASVFRK